MNKESRKFNFFNRVLGLGAAIALAGSAGVYAANDSTGSVSRAENGQGQTATPQTTTPQTTGTDGARGEVGTTQHDGSVTTRQQSRDATDSDVVGTTGGQRDTTEMRDRDVLDDNEEDSSVADTTREDDSSIADTDEEDDSGWFHPRARGTTATEDEDLIDDQDDPREDSIVDREERGIYDSDQDLDDRDDDLRDDDLVGTENPRDSDNIN